MYFPGFLRRLFGRSDSGSNQGQEAGQSATGSVGDDPAEASFRSMLTKPEVLNNPVFLKEGCHPLFGLGTFRQILMKSDLQELIGQVKVMNTSPQMAMLVVGGYGFWAIDFEVPSGSGGTGKENFLERISQPIRRPPPVLAIAAVEQHLMMKGVIRIQVEDQLGGAGQY